jgi:O-antigen biosynthesis protein
MRRLLKVLSKPTRDSALGQPLQALPADEPTVAVIRGSEDVEALYALFLGRLPENDAVRKELTGRPVLEIAERLLTSDEFAAQTLDRFMRQQWLQHQTLPLGQLSRVVEFVLAARLAQTNDAPPQADWKSVLRWVLAGEPCGALFNDHYGELAEQFLDLLGALPSSIATGIDLIANTLCRGWIVDQTNPAAPLHLRVKLNGLTVKVIAADEFRRDVQARYGGDGHAGFTIRVDQLPGAGELRQASLEIIELSQGALVLPERLVELSPAPARRIEAQMRRELIELRRAVERLEEYLPRLEGGQTWPLSAYAAVQPVVDLLPSPPRPDEGGVNFCMVVIDDPDRPQSASASLESVLAQADAADRVVLVLNAAASPPTPLPEPRVELSRRKPGEHPSAAENGIASQTMASHLLILDAGVTLAVETLAWFRAAIAHTGAPVIYSDADRVARDAAEGEDLRPVFRPAFDQELLSQRNYIGNIFCISRDAFVELGGFTCDSSVDPRHDFLLRAAARFGRGALIHLPLVLFHDHASLADDKGAAERLIHTVQKHLERIGSGARAVPHDDIVGRRLPDAVKIVWPENRPRLISVVVPTRDSPEFVSALVGSLRRHTVHWDRIEIVIVVNGNPNQAACDALAEIEHGFAPVRIVNHPVPFNWGAINNTAAAEFSSGDVIVFLNDDMLCVTPGWDSRLRSQLQRPDVAVLGGRLLYPNGAIQHAGIVFGHHAQNLHEGAGDTAGDGLYLDRTLLVHETAAVTGAFLACRRDTFERLGGFNAERFTVTCSDVDFCVRARAGGDLVLYDPFLTWIHYESASRGFDDHSESTRRRFDLEFTNWRSNCPALDLVDLALNPHLVRSPRPFEVFHRVDAETVDTWLAAQQHRQSAGQRPFCPTEKSAGRARLSGSSPDAHRRRMGPTSR